MEEKHVSDALHCLNKYFDKYTCHPIFDENEFRYVFLNNAFVSSYVVLENETVIDMISFYKLPSKVLKDSKNKNYPYINAGYLYYYSSNVETVFTLVSGILVAAKNEGMHVFNVLDIMENKLIFDDLKFQEGTGRLYYYMYNYKCIQMNESQIAKILL